VAVLVDDAGQHGGTAAAPVAAEVVKAYFGKKQQRAAQTTAAVVRPALPATESPTATPPETGPNGNPKAAVAIEKQQR
jgi:hypothetical protein